MGKIQSGQLVASWFMKCGSSYEQRNVVEGRTMLSFWCKLVCALTVWLLYATDVVHKSENGKVAQYSKIIKTS